MSVIRDCVIEGLPTIGLLRTSEDLLHEAVHEIAPAFHALVAHGREELDHQLCMPIEHPLALLIEAADITRRRLNAAKDQAALGERAASEDGPVEQDGLF